MSYEITFTNIPEEVLDKYKGTTFDDANEVLEHIKYTILEDCIKYDKKFDGNLYKFMKDLRYCLNQIKYIQGETAKHDFHNEYLEEGEFSPKNSFTLCGSQYRNCAGFGEHDWQSLYKYCLDKFIMFGAFIEMPSYKEDPEEWENRYNELQETIEYCMEETYTLMMEEIKYELYEYTDEYAESHQPDDEDDINYEDILIPGGMTFFNDNKTNNYDYVDLGLPSGTLWATCNVGANSPTEYGKYFAWGDTDGYYDNEEHVFSLITYKYCNEAEDGIEITKYNPQDGLIDLELCDDAAHVNMGGDWKMPTAEQMEELFNETNHEWVEDYQGSGINGEVFTSKSDNSKNIFIPASGGRWSTSVYNHGDDVYLWSSTLCVCVPGTSLSGYFNSVYSSAKNSSMIYGGFCVRGVLNKTDNIKSDE